MEASLGKRNGFRCFECNRPANHAHHVVPFSLGGTRTIPLCHSCHSLIHDGVGLLTRSQLVRYGIKRVMAEGKRFGGHNFIELPIEDIRELHEEGFSNGDIGELFGVSEATIRRRLSED